MEVIDNLRVSVLDPENDYLSCWESYAAPAFCQRCGVGPPTFACDYTDWDGSSAERYCCKECVLAILEEMKLRGAEVWKKYEAELGEDDLIDVEEHRARRLQIFGA